MRLLNIAPLEMAPLEMAPLEMAPLEMAPLEMAQPAHEFSVDRLARELGATCDVDPATVRQVVRGALRELRGSVSDGSMPEMATRLAAVRLLAYVPSQAAGPAS